VLLDAPGVFTLAPGAFTAAALGALLAVGDRRRLSPARRETLALFGGWGLAFVAASLFLSRPARAMRYYVLLAPPVAAFVGYAASRLFDPPRLRPALGPGLAGSFADASAHQRSLLQRLLALDPWLVLAIAATGAVLWPHLTSVLIGPLAERDVLRCGLQGAGMSMIVLVVGLALELPRPSRRVGLAALLALALGPSTLRLARTLPRLTTYQREANAALPQLVNPEDAVVVGPYASFLAFGHGIQRRRVGDFNTNPGHLEETLAMLRPSGRPWATHLAVDAQQERSAHVVERFAHSGHPLHLVATLTPHGPYSTRILIFRFPWARERGYRLSPHEAEVARLDSEGKAEQANQLRKIFSNK
jgi:hypothetical protein